MPAGVLYAPPVSELGHDLIGPDVRLYWEQAVYKYPERPRRFRWHQDNGCTYVKPQQYVTCWVALSDAMRDSGCPWGRPVTASG
ncbi:MAG: phytanoyl-CoA dioxygenase family protein [Deltaproteobacteria bacterium]|nr:phytanoyl-CoA dioxygenase family protein [Deltaproteobacteria bacterium]